MSVCDSFTAVLSYGPHELHRLHGLHGLHDQHDLLNLLKSQPPSGLRDFLDHKMSFCNNDCGGLERRGILWRCLQSLIYFVYYCNFHDGVVYIDKTILLQTG